MAKGQKEFSKRADMVATALSRVKPKWNNSMSYRGAKTQWELCVIEVLKVYSSLNMRFPRRKFLKKANFEGSIV